MSDDSSPNAEPTGSPSPEGAQPRMDLPKWNRARVKRVTAEGDGPDAFQQGVARVGKKAARRGLWVALGIVGALALLGGGLAWRQIRQDQRAERTRTLAEAAAWRARGEAVPNLEELRKSWGEYPFPNPVVADAAALASEVDSALSKVDQLDDAQLQQLGVLLRGGEQVQQGQFAAARESFSSFLGAVGNGHTLAFLAQEGVIVALEGEGKLDEALAACDALIGEPGAFYRDQGLYHRGRLLQALGRPEEAIAAYRQYAEEFPLDRTSLAQDQVIERLKDLDPSFELPSP